MTANPDVLVFNGRTLLYYRGTGVVPGDDVARDRLAVADMSNLSQARLIETAPGVDALDPAAVVFGGKVLLYYSALTESGDFVGCAESEDGWSFVDRGAVLPGRAPEVVAREGRLYLFSQDRVDDGGYGLVLYESEDGTAFREVGPVFGARDDWDSFSIVTARIHEADGWYWMLYGGSSTSLDEPDHFGLARSKDLLNWERHPGNPIFGCGPAGAQDGGSIWFPALMESPDGFTLLYEGVPGKGGWEVGGVICAATLEGNEI
jgi:predicted GH43/DUF377 family glycosyl hydrolase